MIRSRSPRVLLLLAAVAVGYHWLGISICAIGIVVFMLYELLNPPPRYRMFGPGQSEEAIDNRFGRFGRTYREADLLRSPRAKCRETILVPAAVV